MENKHLKCFVYNILLDPSLFEGDMILTPEQLTQARQGRFIYATTVGKQWPDKTVYYLYALDVRKYTFSHFIYDLCYL